MTSGNLDVEAFQMIMRAWVDEISTKQTGDINAKIDELKESNKKQLEEQTENFRQDTVKIAESLEAVSYTHLDVYKRQEIYSTRKPHGNSKMDNRVQGQAKLKGQGFCQADIIRTATYNVISIKHKRTELERTLLEKKIKIVTITETEKKI